MDKDISKQFLIIVGANVKQKRIEKNLSLDKLGFKVGLNRMKIQRIERGYNITLQTVLKLSIALGIKPEELVKSEIEFNKKDLEELVDTNKSTRLKKSPKKK